MPLKIHIEHESCQNSTFEPACGSGPQKKVLLTTLGHYYDLSAWMDSFSRLKLERRHTPLSASPGKPLSGESPHSLLLWPPGDLRLSHKNKTTRWDYSFHVSSCLQYPIAYSKWIILLTLSLAKCWNSSSAGIHTDSWLDREFRLENTPCLTLSI